MLVGELHGESIDTPSYRDTRIVTQLEAKGGGGSWQLSGHGQGEGGRGEKQAADTHSDAFTKRYLATERGRNNVLGSLGRRIAGLREV